MAGTLAFLEDMAALEAATPWDDAMADLVYLKELCMIGRIPAVFRILRPYYPSAAEKADAALYAANVRAVVDAEYKKLHAELHGE